VSIFEQTKKNSSEKFGEQQQGVQHLLGLEELGYLIKMIDETSHLGRHLELALQCKFKLQAKINNIMKIKE
jgi:hypothetical protein